MQSDDIMRFDGPLGLHYCTYMLHATRLRHTHRLGRSINIAVSELLVAACERVAQMQNNIISPRFIFVHISLTLLT